MKKDPMPSDAVSTEDALLVKVESVRRIQMLFLVVNVVNEND